MRQTENFSWLKIAVYSTTLNISIVFVVTVSTYTFLKLGYDVSADAGILLLVTNLPPLIISYLVYFMLAKGLHSRPFEHAFVVYCVSLLIGFLLDFLIPVNLISWSVIIVELFVYIGILVLATQHGIKYRKRKGFLKNAA